jgi:hypothetical protein
MMMMMIVLMRIMMMMMMMMIIIIIEMMRMRMMTLMRMRMMFNDCRWYRRSIHPVHATHSSIVARGLQHSRLPLLSHRQHR